MGGKRGKKKKKRKKKLEPAKSNNKIEGHVPRVYQKALLGVGITAPVLK